MKQNNPVLHLVTIILRFALLVALVAAGWNIYRTLPDAAPENRDSGNVLTELQLALRAPAGESGVQLSVPLELYPIDLAAASNEFFSERRPGKRFDDFLAERMGARAPVEGRFDQNGQATVKVKPGPWWIHVTLPGAFNIEWRLRINASGSRQMVELNPDNAYTRTKSF